MKFSILIANYNNGKYFKECYDSIMAQTHKNWEVIIVDDASTDNSVELIKKIIGDDSRFIFLENDINKGCGFTKRKTLEFATGKICGFLDPDDAITQKAVALSLSKYTSENIVATYSKITFCDENLKPQYNFEKIKKIYNNKYFFNCPIQINAFFTFRKSAYDKTEGINSNLSSAVDQDLYLKILEHGNPVFIRKNLYLYRRHLKGISQGSLKNNAKENFAKVIFDAFKRRKIEKINGVKVPEEFHGEDQIFKLLDYQNSIIYRLMLRFYLNKINIQKKLKNLYRK